MTDSQAKRGLDESAEECQAVAFKACVTVAKAAVKADALFAAVYAAVVAADSEQTEELKEPSMPGVTVVVGEYFLEKLELLLILEVD